MLIYSLRTFLEYVFLFEGVIIIVNFLVAVTWKIKDFICWVALLLVEYLFLIFLVHITWFLWVWWKIIVIASLLIFTSTISHLTLDVYAILEELFYLCQLANQLLASYLFNLFLWEPIGSVLTAFTIHSQLKDDVTIKGNLVG
jgi:hypothetical protein